MSATTTTSPVNGKTGGRSGGVQSLERAFHILEAMADSGGIIGLSQLADKVDLPLATIHRLVRSLVDLGYVRQEANRQYSLGPRLMRLAAESGKRIGALAKPLLTEAVEALDESVNLAILDDDEIVYVAQVQPSRNFMRMFTEVGRRTTPHSTAVGKAILASSDDVDVVALLERTGMPRRTEHTLTTAEEFLTVLRATRARGFAMDEGEQEVGVRCVAVAVPGAPRPMALSMSGPTTRMDDATVERGAKVLREVAAKLAKELGANDLIIA
ncbi:MAG: IclR family transcriptional regulator [Ornithinimicrobium sp.]|uniref:IclR family transcriptional regulator n=1 Tax=Ornithinimicrobium sp. TaxID=1977084 RepID=UPI0026DFF930|nr:IclR family transcriptional regulator [Ornithinimicrobium sp.]MDO5739665.1 IclR family transcriptional regulator [Ornithinimicrobium sp.]